MTHETEQQNKAITAQVLRRAAEIKQEKAQRKYAWYRLGSIAAALAFISCLALQMPRWMLQMNSSNFTTDSAVASLLSNSPFVGYLVVGMISFVLGAFITVLCYQWQRTKKEE